MLRKSAVLSLSVVALWATQSPLAATAATPGADECRRYGAFTPVAGAFHTAGPGLSAQCVGHWLAQTGRAHDGSPSAAVLGLLTRFVDGVRSGKADLGEMTSKMVQAYGNGTPVEMPPKSQIAHVTSARLLGADAQGNDVYAVGLAGGGWYWTINVNQENKVEAAFLHFGNS